MKKTIYFIFIYIILIACGSTSAQNDVAILQKRTNLPLKLIYNSQENDSSYIYLCFPKKIYIENQPNIKNKIHNYHVGQHHKNIDILHYKTYEYTNKLIIKKDITLNNNETKTFILYHGYLLKVLNEKLDVFIKNKKESQILQGFSVYDIYINDTIKKWAISKISDSLKGKLHFSLHNKEKGFFYKSLDIELFDD
ncbi:hypothetical protein [Aquimarina longa]|uniref:hypothetical protein n=1 Tax=Aquimarina longa TaxID=1080221 RepID=UPI00078419F1|nr:hypothetical protein [Aquimarina longa]